MSDSPLPVSPAAPAAPAGRVQVHALVGGGDGVPRSIRPRPASEQALGWKRKPMVKWLDPKELSATAVRAVLSAVFGSYADKREVQAALVLSEDAADGRDNDHLFTDYSAEEPTPQDQGGFWFDYAADLGDGFESTYTVATFLGADSIRLEDAAGRSARPGWKWQGGAAAAASELPRGRVLVMGGDQVYPTASREEYTDRCSGPYEAVLPGCEDPERAPRLFAIPGNHDWYDGLTAFMRLFGQGRWIGGWKTEQKRSYFAVRLPNRWWLLGIDVQLQSDIDKPQLDYFCRVAREHMQPGDRVVLCTAEPAWAFTKAHDDAYDNLAFFESAVLRPAGAELALTLTGDLHHYARYTSGEAEATRQRHKITAGGGGAYLLGTGWLPETVKLEKSWKPDEDGGETEEFALKEAYPDKAKSRKLRWGALKASYKNLTFSCFLGTTYAAFAWFLQSASKTRTYELEEKLKALSDVPTPEQVIGVVQAAGGNYLRHAAAQDFSPSGAAEVFGYFWNILTHAPALMIFALLFVGGMVAFCTPDPGTPKRLQGWVKRGVGVVHGVLHVVLIVALTWAFAKLNIDSVEPGAAPGGPLASLGNAVEAVLVWIAGAGSSLPLVGGLFQGLGTLAAGGGANPDSFINNGLFVVEMFTVGGLLAVTLFSLFLLPGLNYNEAFSAQYLEGYKNFLRLRIDRQTGELTVYPFAIDRVSAWEFGDPKGDGAASADTQADRARPYFRPTAGREPVARLIEKPIRIAGAPQQGSAATAKAAASESAG